MKRRTLILLLGGASSGAMSVGTGAFSSMEAERGVEVNVVSDDQAFVGYDNPSNGKNAVSVSDGESIELVVVKNRFSGDAQISIVDVDVTVNPEEGDSSRIENVAFSEDEFGAGEEESITGTVACDDDGGSAEVEVTVRLAGDGVSAELFGDTETRRFEIECVPIPAVTGVDFRGGGNTELLVADEGPQSADGGTVEVEVYYVDGDRIRTTDSEAVEVDRPLRNQMSIVDETIVGVHVPGTEDVYVHPQFDPSECDLTPDADSEESGVSGGTGTPISDPAETFGDCLAADD
ncbi:MAG: hypothetical protein R6U01_08560 [Halorubrum sp.]|uniref:hypothetical protein n=1 Tax=Halorubrum sp. TaxID=1879286 RepID=UPI003970845B